MNQNYQPAWPFTSGWFNTIATNFWRSVGRPVAYQRSFVSTQDADTVAIDTAGIGSSCALLMVHGLEGNSYSAYMRGMARAAHGIGADAISMNLRGCGGHEPMQPATYHSGKTEDLAAVVEHLQQQRIYRQIGLIGFSLGGNLVLKYAGEQGSQLSASISAVSAMGMPYDLAQTAEAIDQPRNWLFKQHFLSSLRQRAIHMKARWPALPYSTKAIRAIRSLWAFDDSFTAPMNGFAGASAYYQQCSCKHFLADIAVPTQLVSAQDDPFVPAESVPCSEIRRQPHINFLNPQHGGHLGFGQWRMPGLLWHEQQAGGFMSHHLGQNS
jgi:predicted alpha/beta-fold hydrolase